MATSVALATPEDARAEQLFAEGQSLLRAGDVARACGLLAESLRLDAGLGTLLNLALCHERQGKLATASREYALAADWARARGESERERLLFAEERARSLGGRVPRLWIAVTERDADLVVRLDGRPLAAAEIGRWLEVDPGDHHLEAQLRNRVIWHRGLQVVSGARYVEHVRAPELESEQSREGVSPWTYVIGGVGAASVITGAAFLIRANTYDERAQQKTREYHSQSPRDVRLKDAALDDYDTAVEAQRIGLLSGAAGLVGLGAATVFWLRERGREGARASAVLEVRPSAGGAALMVHGAF